MSTTIGLDRGRGPEATPRRRGAARDPTTRRARRARRGPRALRGRTASGEPTVLLLPTWSIVHSRHLEGADPLPGPALPRRHVRRARQRAVRPAAGCRRLRRARVRGRRPGGAGRDRHRARGRSSGLSSGAHAALCSPPSTPSAWPASSSSGPPAPLGRRAARDGDRGLRRRARPTYDGWAKYNRHLLAATTTATSSSSSSARMFPEPHSTKQIEDGVGWGLRHDAETLIATHDRGRAAPATPRAARAGRRVSLPGARRPRHATTRSSHADARVALAELTGGGCSRRRGRAATPRTRATRCRSTC